MLLKEKILLLLIALLSSGPINFQQALTPEIAAPLSLRPGDPLIINVPSEVQSVVVDGQSQNIALVQGKRLVLYPVPINFKEKVLTVTAQTPYSSSSKSIQIIQRPKVEITQPLFLPPTKEALAKIEADKTIKAEIPQRIGPQSLFSLLFTQPLVNSTITSPFYELRVEGPHYGTDLKAKEGLPVKSIGNGKVIFAQKLFLEGNMVVIDHGSKVISYYLHLSRFADGLSEGKLVKAGDIIGYSGKTGQVTAAHLHFAMKINGEFVDPEKFIATMQDIARQ